LRAPALRLHHDELIVDNFAGGGGASLGIEWALGRSPDIAINHDAEAIAMHAANHPATRHYCEDVWKVDPREACRGRPVGLAWFSPDCKHFSKAKGGKPVDKKIRGPRVDRDPLGEGGAPARHLPRERRGVRGLGSAARQRQAHAPSAWPHLPDLEGKLEALGYKVEWRELVGVDYGARRRGSASSSSLGAMVCRSCGRQRRRTFRVEGRTVAADCIDWSLPTYSIFLSKEEARQHKIMRPLADNTMRRIARGLKKFVIDNPSRSSSRTTGSRRTRRRAHSLQSR
jgi:DNA (cytosine-5)-methyltransferase 1